MSSRANSSASPSKERTRAGSGSFLTGKLSRHARTNIEVISKFMPAAFKTEQTDNGCYISLK
jgi:hypothetical protein